MKRYIKCLFLFLIMLLFLTACQNKEKFTISIAEQYGLAYAPLQIMKEKGILEENLPGLKVEWKQLANTAAIREAMLAGRLDIGFMAIPPFLIGFDKGMEWKIISALSESPLGLVTYREDIESLADFSERDRIALPQPGSIQHILLSMAAERELGDVHSFDNRLLTMAHPDGMNALLTRREVTAHFTSPPYIFKELEEDNMHQVISGREAVGGDFTFIVGVSTVDFHDHNRTVYQKLLKSIGEAVDYINNNSRKAAVLLAAQYDLSEEEVYKYLTRPGMKYTMKIKGLDKFTRFLYNNDYLSQLYNAPGDLLWNDDYYEGE